MCRVTYELAYGESRLRGRNLAVYHGRIQPCWRAQFSLEVGEKRKAKRQRIRVLWRAASPGLAAVCQRGAAGFATCRLCSDAPVRRTSSNASSVTIAVSPAPIQ